MEQALGLVPTLVVLLVVLVVIRHRREAAAARASAESRAAAAAEGGGAAARGGDVIINLDASFVDRLAESLRPQPVRAVWSPDELDDYDRAALRQARDRRRAVEAGERYVEVVRDDGTGG